jgi:hypothetical protein
MLYCTILYCTVLYCTVLYCTILSSVHTVLYSFSFLSCLYFPSLCLPSCPLSPHENFTSSHHVDILPNLLTIFKNKILCRISKSFNLSFFFYSLLFSFFSLSFFFLFFLHVLFIFFQSFFPSWSVSLASVTRSATAR